MDQAEALETVYAKYGRDKVSYDPIKRVATVEGVGRIYVMQKMSVRQRLIADLVGTGISVAKAARLVTNNNNGSGHYNRILRNPMMQNYTEQEVTNMVAEAKSKIAGAVLTAAENVVSAVNDGELGASVKVLNATGALVAKSERDVQVSVSFGAWLAAEQGDKTIAKFGDRHEEAQVVPESEAPMGSVDESPVELDPVPTSRPSFVLEPEVTVAGPAPEAEIITGPSAKMPRNMPKLPVGGELC